MKIENGEKFNSQDLHITFGGIFSIQQRLISCPFYWKATLKFWMEKISVKNFETEEDKRPCETLFYDIQDRQCINRASFLNEANILTGG